jgi:SAM-dependent methyltransferase
VDDLREGVRKAYSAAAGAPEGAHPFPVGRQFAESLGYPAALLARLPGASVEAFAGVSNVSIFAEIPAGAAVLDLGCGAGLDTLIAAGRADTVLGIDFSAEMLGRASCAARLHGARNVTLCEADAERLPLPDASIDIALANGIFNLNPARPAIMTELARVLRPGGSLYCAELVLKEPLPPERLDQANWFA